MTLKFDLIYTAVEVVSSPGSLTPEIRRPVSGSQTNQTGGITNPGHGENNLVHNSIPLAVKHASCLCEVVL